MNYYALVPITCIFYHIPRIELMLIKISFYIAEVIFINASYTKTRQYFPTFRSKIVSGR
jgi:hypothetical protein